MQDFEEGTSDSLHSCLAPALQVSAACQAAVPAQCCRDACDNADVHRTFAGCFSHPCRTQNPTPGFRQPVKLLTLLESQPAALAVALILFLAHMTCVRADADLRGTHMDIPVQHA